MERYYLRARYYNPVAGRFMQEDTYCGDGLNLYEEYKTGKIYWPKDDGFAGYPDLITLSPGIFIDRYGSDHGTFTSPVGIPYENRALAPDTILKPYSVFEVIEPIDVRSGEIAPWFDQPSTLYHYTTENGLQGILGSESLYPSIKTSTSKDARMGSGQYPTDIVPGPKTEGQVSRSLFGILWNTNKVAYYIEIDVSGLDIMKGRNDVYYIPGDADLDLTNRIVSFGKTGG